MKETKQAIKIGISPLTFTQSKGTRSQFTPINMEDPHPRCPPRKRPHKAAGLDLFRHTDRAGAGSGPVKGAGILFPSLLPSPTVYVSTINRI